ncbi:hypothetical protein EB796_023449 [Bugula neritina]|uniref:Uncharacterized protein n=1 Tax=Bugula neritina TaxID=10212 RepID=A0A7J7IYD5_BUGNE|nr:hypothetical protein EB796_023449 [Bugula neritina]
MLLILKTLSMKLFTFSALLTIVSIWQLSSCMSIGNHRRHSGSHSPTQLPYFTTPFYDNVTYCFIAGATHPLSERRRQCIASSLTTQREKTGLEAEELNFTMLKTDHNVFCDDKSMQTPYESPVQSEIWEAKIPGTLVPDEVINVSQCGNFTCPRCSGCSKTVPTAETEEKIHIQVSGCSHMNGTDSTSPLELVYKYVVIKTNKRFPCKYVV